MSFSFTYHHSYPILTCKMAGKEEKMWTNYDIEISFMWVHEFNDMLIQGFTKRSSNIVYKTISCMVFEVATVSMQL